MARIHWVPEGADNPDVAAVPASNGGLPRVRYLGLLRNRLQRLVDLEGKERAVEIARANLTTGAADRLVFEPLEQWGRLLLENDGVWELVNAGVQQEWPAHVPLTRAAWKEPLSLEGLLLKVN